MIGVNEQDHYDDMTAMVDRGGSNSGNPMHALLYQSIYQGSNNLLSSDAQKITPYKSSTHSQPFPDSHVSIAATIRVPTAGMAPIQASVALTSILTKARNTAT